MFGLSRRNLILAGMGGGAATGGWLDVATGGTSLFTGAAIGAAIGGTLGYFGAGKLAEVKLIHQPLGGKLLKCGPTRNLNFPFVLLGRARYHHQLVAGRTHAARGKLDITHGEQSPVAALTSDRRKALAEQFRKAGKLTDAEQITLRTRELTAVLEPILAGDDRAEK